MKHAEKIKHSQRYGWIFLILILFIPISLYFFLSNLNKTSIETLSRYGSQGEEVRQIQNKLKELGIYNGSVDGIYGSNTEYSIIEFQKKNNLKADGIAGNETLNALGIKSSQNENINGKYSESDINLLANVISAESRNEPYIGQVAVGAVILNRIEHPSFPNTLAGVVYQPGAFTCMVDGQINEEVTQSSKNAAKAAMDGWDPSNGAIYYYNPNTATNQWIRSRPVVLTIGKHIFCQ